ncbi:HAD family hydrolase [Sphingobacterium suaedae]|uniref:HAD family hydrolase n=1 Tax=Sphingobacterium suaedae TaxID=1686402 RepID=A0ABW5KMU9_9SPHI
MKNRITTIAFDADDTLWVNEPYFQEAEQQFCKLLEDDHSQQAVAQELFRTEMKNLSLYGYGVKGFVLCMIETASRLSDRAVSVAQLNRMLEIGHELLEKPIELLDGVQDTLEQLKGRYRLIMATKGDLLDQQRKLKKSGLAPYFHHIEIMSDKQPGDYHKLIRQLACAPGNFLMLGNSMKSDILPVLELGGFAGHIPYQVTWAHEQHEETPTHTHFVELARMDHILDYLI